MKIKHLFVIFPVAMLLVMTLPFGSTTTDTVPARIQTLPVYDVFAPTAYSGVYAASALKLDGSSTFFGDPYNPSYTWGMQTWGYANPSYSAYWTPWTDRANYPPDNATILSVDMLVVCTIPGGHTALMNATIYSNGTEWKSYSTSFGPTALVHSNPHQPGTYAMEAFRFNMTSAYTQASGYTVLGPVNWTPALIKSISSRDEPAFIVRFFVSGYSYWTGYTKIDYLGIEYTWSPNVTDTSFIPPTIVPTPTTPTFLFPDIFGGGIIKLSMGFIGLIGMIAYPAAAIRAHKRGSQVGESIVGAITVEVIFIGLLYVGLIMT